MLMAQRSLAKLLLLLFLPLFLATFALAQYGTTYSDPVADITPNAKSGANIWKLLPGGGDCQLQSASISTDGNLWCVGTDSHVWKFDMKTATWSKQASMGTAVAVLIVQNDNAIYSLQGVCSGQSPDRYLYKWTGSVWSPLPGCLSQATIASDGFMAGVTLQPNYHNYLWSSGNGGSSWGQWSTGWIHINMWASAIGCAVDQGGSIYQVSSTNPAVYLGATPTTVVGCVVMPLDNAAVMAWDAAGHVYYDDDGTWHTISGLMASQVGVGYTKSSIIGFDSSGHPYHWNTLAGSMTATTAGAWTGGCPGPGQQCNPSATHTLNVKVKFPHSLGGTLASEQIQWSSQGNVSAWDTNSSCDLFVGTPGVECVPVVSGNNVCNQSGASLGGPTGSKFTLGYGNWIVVRNFNYNSWQDPMTGPDAAGRYHIMVHLPMSQDCQYGTVPTCDGHALNFEEIAPGVYQLDVNVSARDVAVLGTLVGIVRNYNGPLDQTSAYLNIAGLPQANSCTKLDLRPILFGFELCD